MGEVHPFDSNHSSIKKWALEDPDNNDSDDGEAQEPLHACGYRDGGSAARRIHVNAFDDHQVVIQRDNNINSGN